MTLHLWSHWFWVTHSGQGLLLVSLLMTIISVEGLPTTHQMPGTSSVIPSEKSDVTQTGEDSDNVQSVSDDLSRFDSNDFFQNTDSSIDVLTTPLSVQNTSVVYNEKAFVVEEEEKQQQMDKLVTTVAPAITSSTSPTETITTATTPHDHHISKFQHKENVQEDQFISQRIGKAIGFPPPSSTASTSASTAAAEHIVESVVHEESIVDETETESVKIVETKNERETIQSTSSPSDAVLVPQYVDDSTAGSESNITQHSFDESFKEQDDSPYESDKHADSEGLDGKVDEIEDTHPVKESTEDAESEAKDVNKYHIAAETTTEAQVEGRIFDIVTSSPAPSPSSEPSTVSDYDEVPSDVVQINDEDKTSDELAEIEYDMTSPELSPPAPPSDSLLPTPATAVTGGRIGGAPPGLDAGTIVGITVGIAVFAGLLGSLAFILYRRRFINKPQALSDKCSNPDSSGYLDDTLRENSEEMYSLDNDSFLNSLEAMTIQNYWTDSVKHTKL